MKLNERATFTWHPPAPLKAFDSAVVASSDDIPQSAYAVTVTARDAEGTAVAPSDGTWPFSSSLGAHFQYSPASEGASSFALKRWEGDTFISSVFIEVVGWLKDQDSPEVLALAFSAAASPDAGARTWGLVYPARSTDRAATA